MKTKLSIFITTVALLLLVVTTSVAQGTKVYFKKNGAVVYESTISDIDSIYFAKDNFTKADYFHTWRSRSDTWEQITINADEIDWLYEDGQHCTIKGLTWIAINNPSGNYTDSYPVGYKVTGTLTENYYYNMPKADGSGNAAIGDIAVNYFYLFVSKGSMRVGNFNSTDHEAYYGPYDIKDNVEYWQVAWELNGGAWTASDNHMTQVAKDGKLASPASSPTKANNNFGGWYKESSLINQVSFPYDVSSVTSDFTLYAKWTDASPSVTLNITVNPGAGFYSSISVMRVSAGTPGQYNVPTSYGTHTVNVSPGTYKIFVSYWSCSYVQCLSSGYSSEFTVSSGQTKNISVVGSGVGM